MAKKNTVEVTYKVKEDGTLGKVGKQADKTAKSTEKLGKSNAKAVKGMKGVGQAGLSASKGFSKMRNSMGDGGSGLVAAYATLAANVFALTAAFAALSGAFQAQTLIASVNFLGNEIGRNLDSTVKKLQDVTDGALSMEAALRGAALGTSAGFSTDQITGLAEVARGASLALGRDMGDAFDRLIRGTAKLEPEILDELGIIVRLDQAYEDYATKLGKTATQLTTVEKSQAFTNAAMREGANKFGDLGKAIRTNPYDKLIATLINLKNEFVGWMNETLKFGAMAEFLSENVGALAGVLGVFASTIAGKLIPSLYGSATAMHASAVAAQELAVSQLSTLNATTQGAAGWNKYLGGLGDGSKTLADAGEGHKAINRSIAGHQGELTKLTKAGITSGAQVDRQTQAIRELTLERQKLSMAQQMGQRASAKETAALSIQNFSTFNLRLGYQFLRQSITEYGLSLTVAGAQTTGFIALLNALKVAAFSTGVAVKALGAVLLTVFGWAAAIAGIGYTLWVTLKDKFFPEDITKKRTDAVLESIGKLSSVQDQYGASIKKGAQKEMAGLHMVSGAMQQQAQNISDMMSLQKQREDSDTRTAALAHKDSNIALADAGKERLAAEERLRLAKLAKAAQITARKAGNRISQPKRQVVQAELDAAEEAGRLSQEAYEEARLAVSAAFVAKVQLATEQRDPEAGDQVRKQGLVAIAAVIKEMEAGPLSTLFEPAILQLKELQKEGVTLEEIHTGIAEIAKAGEDAEGFIKGIASSVNELEKAQNKFGAKATTPYDEILKTAEGVQTQFKNLEKAGPEMTASILKNLDALTMGKDKTIFGGAAGIDEFVKKLKSSLSIIRNYAAVQKKNQQAQKLIASTQNSSVVSLKAQHVLEKASVKNKRDLYDATVIANAAAFANKELNADGTENAGFAEAKKKNKLLLDQVELEEALYSSNIAGVEVEQLQNTLAKEELGLKNQVLAAENKALDLKKEALQVEAKIKALEEFRSGGREDPTVTANELYIIHLETREEQLALLDKQESSALTMAELDNTMLRLKFKLIREQLRAAKLLTKDDIERLDGYSDTLTKALKITKENIEFEFALRKDKIALEGLQLKQNAIDAILAAAGSGDSTRERIDSMNAAMRGKPAVKAQAAVGVEGEEGYKPAVEAQAYKPGVAFDSLKMSEQIAATTAVLDPMIEKLKSLGPEGELAASIASGSLAIGEAFNIMSENIGNKADSTAEKLKMASVAISAIAGMASAASEAKIAGIDREIAAEQKRDGKSKASIAKIAGLEAKKEKAKRKAFEQNKKMQMAMVVINVAASIASNVAAASAAAAAGGPAAPAIFAGVLGGLNGVTLGMGLAQLAVIASTSYQGGGSGGGGGAAAPASISVGERSNTVDLAKGNNAGGELGYMRGESGTGTGATNFKPTGAFTGARYRGSGGYIVGEQGPELFVPQESGEVISAGNTAGIGGSTNVSFNIQAIDASGVEDVLIAQKGQIIRMIREAANEHGEFFLEGVREEAYQQ